MILLTRLPSGPGIMIGEDVKISVIAVSGNEVTLQFADKQKTLVRKFEVSPLKVEGTPERLAAKEVERKK